MSDRIHCVLPTYRPGIVGSHRHYIPNLHASLFSATTALGMSDAFVVVHDGSPEPVREAASAILPPSCPEVVLIDNEGTAGALNAGFESLEEQRGPSIYRTWVSDDNLYDLGCFDRLARHLDENPACVLVAGQFRTIGQDGIVQRHKTAQQQMRLIENCNVGIAFLYRTDAAKTVGPYRFGMAQDWDYWLRIEEVGRVDYLPDVLASWRNHADTGLHSGRVRDDSAAVQAEAKARRSAKTAS